MNKSALFLLLTLICFSQLTWADDEGDDAEQPAVEQPAADAQPPVLPSDDDSGDTPQPPANVVNTQAQNCLDAIYARQTSNPPDAADMIVVTATRFNPHFTSESFLSPAQGETPDGRSYFLTSNQFLNSDTTFRVYETAGSGSQWKCGSAERLRRLDDEDDDDGDYDSGTLADARDTARTTQDLNAADEWGRGRAVPQDSVREAVYYVKIETRHFRISCRLANGFGVNRNHICTGDPVSLGQVSSSNLKTCRAENKPIGHFIKRALREREKILRKQTPENSQRWASVTEDYNDMKTQCSSLISSHSGAQDALSDLGKEINERIRSFNRRRPAGSAAVNPVVAFED